MWQSVNDVNNSKGNGWKASTSNISTKGNGQQHSLLKRALSFQFLNKKMPDGINKDELAHIKMRYKDVSKFVIWPSCPLPNGKSQPMAPSNKAPIHRLLEAEKNLRKVELEDDRTPYPRCAINAVLRSDSEDSSDAEEIVHMTRL